MSQDLIEHCHISPTDILTYATHPTDERKLKMQEAAKKCEDCRHLFWSLGEE